MCPKYFILCSLLVILFFKTNGQTFDSTLIRKHNISQITVKKIIGEKLNVDSFYFNAKGKLVKKVINENNFNNHERKEYHYTYKDNLLFKVTVQILRSNKTFFKSTLFEYDTKNRLISETFQSSVGYKSLEKYLYPAENKMITYTYNNEVETYSYGIPPKLIKTSYVRKLLPKEIITVVYGLNKQVVEEVKCPFQFKEYDTLACTKKIYERNGDTTIVKEIDWKMQGCILDSMPIITVKREVKTFKDNRLIYWSDGLIMETDYLFEYDLDEKGLIIEERCYLIKGNVKGDLLETKRYSYITGSTAANSCIGKRWAEC